METYNIEADENWKGKRVDKSLADYFDDYSRSFLKKLLDDGNVLVNDKKAKPSLKIASGDKIDITIPDISPVEIEPEDIPLDIVYEDDDIIIVNKPKGMVVHPAPGHYSGTLVNGLMYHFKDSLSGINGELRPGIVHRIDILLSAKMMLHIIFCRSSLPFIRLQENTMRSAIIILQKMKVW